MKGEIRRRARLGLVGLLASFVLLTASSPALAGHRQTFVPDQGSASHASKSGTGGGGDGSSDAAQRAALDETNQDRAQHQIKALKLDKKLSRYATKHSKQMANKNALFHTSNLAGVLHGGWHVAGENVGNGPTVDDVNTAFMNSAEHRKNILRKAFDHAAVGVYTDSSGGVWVTVIFYG